MVTPPEVRIQQLRDAIRHHEERYYVLNDPEISDEEFAQHSLEMDNDLPQDERIVRSLNRLAKHFTMENEDDEETPDVS